MELDEAEKILREQIPVASVQLERAIEKSLHAIDAIQLINEIVKSVVRDAEDDMIRDLLNAIRIVSRIDTQSPVTVAASPKTWKVLLARTDG